MWGVGGGFELRNKQKKKTIIPVILLCSFHCLGKVKKKLTTGKASCVSILPWFFLSPLPLIDVYRTCCYAMFSTSTLMSLLIFYIPLTVNKSNEMPPLMNVSY